MKKILTIVVPTFNRADCLERLLNTLGSELAGLEDRVTVIVGDNASTDRTSSITAKFALQWPTAVIIRHSANLGPDENFCRCVELVETAFFWIIGDDDLPRAGAIPLLIEILDDSCPDLVYLSSRWSSKAPDNGSAEPMTELSCAKLDRRAFARKVHVWTTFISGMIVKRSLAPDAALRRFTGTSLVQLGWVFGALQAGETFIHVETPIVLATSGNSGGYKVLQVFGNNFPRITREAFGNGELKPIAQEIISRAAVAFLPDLVWATRKNRLGAFDPHENVAATLKPELGRTAAYHFLLRPLGGAGPLLGFTIVRLAHALTRVYAWLDRVHAKAPRQRTKG